LGAVKDGRRISSHGGKPSAAAGGRLQVRVDINDEFTPWRGAAIRTPPRLQAAGDLLDPRRRVPKNYTSRRPAAGQILSVPPNGFDIDVQLRERGHTARSPVPGGEVHTWGKVSCRRWVRLRLRSTATSPLSSPADTRDAGALQETVGAQEVRTGAERVAYWTARAKRRGKLMKNIDWKGQ